MFGLFQTVMKVLPITAWHVYTVYKSCDNGTFGFEGCQLMVVHNHIVLKLRSLELYTCMNIYLYKCIIRVTSGYPNDTFYGILALELPKFGHLNGRAIFLLWTKDWK